MLIDSDEVAHSGNVGLYSLTTSANSVYVQQLGWITGSLWMLWIQWRLSVLATCTDTIGFSRRPYVAAINVQQLE